MDSTDGFYNLPQNSISCDMKKCNGKLNGTQISNLYKLSCNTVLHKQLMSVVPPILHF